jgi:hypothetical protein
LVCIKYKIGAFSTTRLERSPQQDWSVLHNKIGAFSTTRLERSPQQDWSVRHNKIGAFSTTTLLTQLSMTIVIFWKTLTWSHYFIKRGSLWNAMKLVSPATFWSSYPNYPNKSELSFICVRCFEFVSVSMIFRLYFGTVLSDDAVFFCFFIFIVI